MFFIGTRTSKELCNFNDAILNVIVKQQGGIFVPSFLAPFDFDKILELSGKKYKDILIELIFLISDGNIDKSILQEIIECSFKDFHRGFGDYCFEEKKDIGCREDVIAIHDLEKNVKIADLTFGPTGCCKDYGYCVAANIVNYLAKQDGRPRSIIDVSGGNSGVSMAWAIKNKDYLRGFILLCSKNINNSVKALTAQACKDAKNVDFSVTSADSYFFNKMRYDVCNNTSLREILNMTFINELNLIFIFAYLPLFFKIYASCNNKPFCISLPTDNMSLCIAAFFAKKIGIPIRKIVLSIEKNDFLKKIQDNKVAINNLKIDEGFTDFCSNIPANFERLLFYLYNANQSSVKRVMQELESGGRYKISDSLLMKFKEHFYVAQCSNQFAMHNIVNSFVRERKMYVGQYFAVAKIGFDEASREIPEEINDTTFVILNTLDYRRDIEFVNTSLGYDAEQVKYPWTDKDVKMFMPIEIASDSAEILNYIVNVFDKK